MNLRNSENWKYMKAFTDISNKVHMRSLRFGLCMIFFWFALTASAQQVLSLDSVLKRIKHHHPMLLAYQSKAEAYQEYASAAKAQMAPEIGGGFWMTPYPWEKVEPMNKGQFMISVQQKITNRAKLQTKQKYLASQSSIEQMNEKILFNEHRSEARLNYVQRVALEEKLAILKENESNVQLALKIAKVRYSLNREKLSTIYKTEARIGEIQNQMIITKSQIQQKTIALNWLMNLPRTHEFAVDTNFAILSSPLAEESSNNQSIVQKLDQTIRSLKLNQETELAQSKSDFSLNFSHMVPLGSMPNQFMLQAMVSIPIAPWSAKSYQSNSRGMEKEIQSTQREKEAVINELQQQISNTIVEIRTTQTQLENYTLRILPMLKKNYEVTFQAYEENKEELSEVISAWEALLDSQMQYIDLKFKLYENQINYEKLHDK